MLRRFGHGAKKCVNDKSCLKCAGDHTITECKRKNNTGNNRCTNCTYYNYKCKTNYKTDHTSYDLEKCEALKGRINKVLAGINYPVRPNIDERMVFNKKLLSHSVE